MTNQLITTIEYMDDLARLVGLNSPQFKAALAQRGLVVLAKPAKAVYCWCLVPKGHPFAGHTGICCEVHIECDLPFCYCDCPVERDPWDDGIDFADPGGRSALRAATHERCPSHHCHRKVGRTWSWCPGCGTKLNPRKHPCPNCGVRDVLTDEDVALHYQCDRCADRAEGIYRGADY